MFQQQGFPPRKPGLRNPEEAAAKTQPLAIKNK
jgi:hypothetical protein